MVKRRPARVRLISASHANRTRHDWRRWAWQGDQADVAAQGFTRPPSRTVILEALIRRRRRADR